MVTEAENYALTKVGRGTPGGELLRRYWHPVAAVSELDVEPVLPIRILGEDLVLYRDRGDRLGLLAAECSHRKVSLAYGIPEEEGLRCCYHGWLYSSEGRCLEQPAEPENSRFKERIQQLAYPVQELGGLVFAYLGPQPAPLLPRFDVFVWEEAWRDIGKVLLPCNWLQCAENHVDQLHVDYLHGRYFDYVLESQGEPPIPNAERVNNRVKQVELKFEPFEFGIRTRARLEGQTEFGQGKNPLVFPNMSRSGGRGTMQIHVPIDDTHTMNYFYACYRPDDGLPVTPQVSIPVYDVPLYDERGRHSTDWISGQDLMAWVQQGTLMDRSTEHVASSDQGVALFRRILLEEMEKVQAGADPYGVLRDPTKNTFISLAKEEGPVDSVRSTTTHAQRYSPIVKEAKELMERHKKVQHLEGVANPTLVRGMT